VVIFFFLMLLCGESFVFDSSNNSGCADCVDVKHCGLFLILLMLGVGCGPMPRRDGASPVVASASPVAYTIAMPDVLEVRFIDHAALDCLASVDVDGTIDLHDYGRPVVERCTVEEARHRIASAVGMSPGKITVRPGRSSSP
jgi:hypothetical protein